jgi:hypothetical protein
MTHHQVYQYQVVQASRLDCAHLFVACWQATSPLSIERLRRQIEVEHLHFDQGADLASRSIKHNGLIFCLPMSQPLSSWPS